MDSILRPVVPTDLYRLIDQADHLVVSESPAHTELVLFESNNRKDLDALKESIQVHKSEEYYHCMCSGSPVLFLYKNSKQLAQITNHHGRSIRCSLWNSDALLVSQKKWINWFYDRGIKEPRREVFMSDLRQRQSEKDSLRWLDAMPVSIRTIWDDFVQNGLNIDISSFIYVLSDEIPDQSSRILALMSWFGSGAGPWSGFPAYERAAEDMLLEYRTTDILSALESVNLVSDLVLEGAARLFGGWSFSKKRPKDLNTISAELKSVLWKHIEFSPDTDKRERARRAFKG